MCAAMPASAGCENNWKRRMSEWLAMGGHAVFVWSSFGLAAATVLWNIWAARAWMRHARDEITEIWDEDDGA